MIGDTTSHYTIIDEPVGEGVRKARRAKDSDPNRQAAIKTLEGIGQTIRHNGINAKLGGGIGSLVREVRNG